jgi:selenocysteine lyase/cysteine desulfurase
MEHHSNHISWLETIADVEIISGAKDGNVDLYQFRELLEKYKYRKNKIAAVTACSNVTGIQTPYYDIAELIHRQGGLCFVDFACSAPYVAIQMHPSGEVRHLDAIYFSPHKFLGGPGSPGVLIFNSRMYHNKVPDHPGGGTVVYSNPWKEHEYVSTIEEKEDGGTPPFIGAIRAAQCILLKEQMGTENILAREREILDIIFERFKNIQGVQVLEQEYRHRLGVVSFVVCDGHYNSFVKILNDRFGVQTRGGCSCAGPYGHYLLNVNKARSYDILKQVRQGNLLAKPGWVRLSIHPCMSNDDIHYIMDSIELTATNYKKWVKDLELQCGNVEM